MDLMRGGWKANIGFVSDLLSHLVDFRSVTVLSCSPHARTVMMMMMAMRSCTPLAVCGPAPVAAACRR